MKKAIKPRRRKHTTWVIQLKHPTDGWIAVDRVFVHEGVAYMISQIYERCGAKSRIKKVKFV